MTIRDALHMHLNEGGLFASEAGAVLNELESESERANMKPRWAHDVSEYPPSLIRVLEMAANAKAVQWIDANCPEHWARPVFVARGSGE